MFEFSIFPLNKLLGFFQRITRKTKQEIKKNYI